jgi:hypothetical protein
VERKDGEEGQVETGRGKGGGGRKSKMKGGRGGENRKSMRIGAGEKVQV